MKTRIFRWFLGSLRFGFSVHWEFSFWLGFLAAKWESEAKLFEWNENRFSCWGFLFSNRWNNRLFSSSTFIRRFDQSSREKSAFLTDFSSSKIISFSSRVKLFYVVRIFFSSSASFGQLIQRRLYSVSRNFERKKLFFFIQSFCSTFIFFLFTRAFKNRSVERFSSSFVFWNKSVFSKESRTNRIEH